MTRRGNGIIRTGFFAKLSDRIPFKFRNATHWYIIEFIPIKLSVARV